jgi:hypothetical protein
MSGHTFWNGPTIRAASIDEIDLGAAAPYPSVERHPPSVARRETLAGAKTVQPHREWKPFRISRTTRVLTRENGELSPEYLGSACGFYYGVRR